MSPLKGLKKNTANHTKRNCRNKALCNYVIQLSAHDVGSHFECQNQHYSTNKKWSFVCFSQSGISLRRHAPHTAHALIQQHTIPSVTWMAESSYSEMSRSPLHCSCLYYRPHVTPFGKAGASSVVYSLDLRNSNVKGQPIIRCHVKMSPQFWALQAPNIIL